MSAEHYAQTMSVEQAQIVFRQAFDQVCHFKKRVEINDGEHACVLISKEELDCLERALEILSDTTEVKRVARQIAALTQSLVDAPLAASGT